MANIYEMNAQIESLLDSMIDEDTGEVNEEALEQLEQLEADKDEKIKNTGLFIKNRMAFADALSKEIDALKKRRQAVLNSVARAMDYADYALEGKPKEFAEVKFGYMASQSVDIVNEDLVPDEYCVYKTERKPQKTEIKKLLKNGKEVPGCVLVDKNNLQIK